LLRIHPSRQGVRWALREFEVPRFLARLRYPVPGCLLLEETCGLFGGPFLIMQEIHGHLLLQAMLAHPLRPLRLPALMARTHARLHVLPTEGFPARAGEFLARELRDMRAAIVRHGFRGLQPGLDWLRSHRPAAPIVPSILHLDFHPLNLILRRNNSLAVIDWTYADLGDPHADVATTLLLLECVPAPVTGLWNRLGAAVGRRLIANWYLRSYRQLRPLDEKRLTYYRAWSALHQLIRYGSALRAGPEAQGCKSSLVEHLTPELLGALCEYVKRWAGVDVSL
jgi:aminoglycoside phosphotransferase (APT) family kinase protein